MKTENVVCEFIRSVDNSRRFGSMLYRSIKGPKEKPHKIFMLDDLRETGKARLKDIAARTGQSPQNLCILYNGLEKEGLVAREVDPSDRRSTYYSITAKGKRLIEKNKGKAREVIAEVFSKLPDEDLDVLKESLQKSNEIIDKVLEQLP